MSAHRVAQRYAKSLLDLAIDQKQLDTVVQDIDALKSSLASKDLFLLLKSPIVNSTKKLNIFKELFGNKFSSLTMAFLERVIAKRSHRNRSQANQAEHENVIRLRNRPHPGQNQR